MSSQREFDSMPSASAKEKLFSIMARLTIAICFICCLYFLVVCVRTHRNDEKDNRPSIDKLVQNFINYDPKDPDMLVHDVTNEKFIRRYDDRQQQSHSNIRQTKSVKLASDIHKNLIDINDDDSTDEQQTTPRQHFVVEQINESYKDCGYHLAFTLIERDHNEHSFKSKLMNKFSNTLSSILLNINSTGLDPGSLCIHLITDDSIRPHLRQTIAMVHEELAQKSNPLTNMSNMRHYHRRIEMEQHRPLTRYFFIDSTAVQSKLEYLLPTLRTFFTHKLNSYYSNALFFYSLILHRVIPSTIADRLILLDVDVQLDANILELFEEFGRFKPDEVIGIAYEQQPVYRHILHEYRRDNGKEETIAGSPPPKGFPGFNSGVVLLHLRKLRESKLYNSFLNSMIITHLCQKYRFRGHLGDQDFYTVIGIDHRSLFHVLPCGWNRQLCQWWRFHGYGSVFDKYHQCQTPIMLYHGNCNSALPTLTYYGDYRRR